MKVGTVHSDFRSKWICLPIFSDQISELSQQFKVDPELIEKIVEDHTYIHANRCFYVIVLDKHDHYTSVTRKISQSLQSHKIDSKRPIELCLDYIQSPATQQACFNGIYLSQYRADLYKSDQKKVDLSDVREQLYHNSDVELANLNDRAYALAKGQYLCMDLLNQPANKKTPQLLCDKIQTRLTNTDICVTVWDEERCAQEGLQAFLSVNRGSEHPGRFMILEYQPSSAKKHIGLVGKGVTFDSGGISIKGSANMHYMKSDMGGATAILGAMQTIAEQKINVRVTAVMAFTDNAVDAKSIHPSDVVQSHAGHSIEIIDTDAEGRLCLADGLSSLIKNYQIDEVVDLATLTGSIVQTLGYQAAGLFSRNSSLEQAILNASKNTGEQTWPMPLWEEYKQDLASDVADIKNFSGRKVAGAISAALFLQRFTHEHPAWAHLDIAGVAFGEVPYAQMKAATGYGVHLIFNWISQAENI